MWIKLSGYGYRFSPDHFIVIVINSPDKVLFPRTSSIGFPPLSRAVYLSVRSIISGIFNPRSTSSVLYLARRYKPRSLRYGFETVSPGLLHSLFCHGLYQYSAEHQVPSQIRIPQAPSIFLQSHRGCHSQSDAETDPRRQGPDLFQKIGSSHTSSMCYSIHYMRLSERDPRNRPIQEGTEVPGPFLFLHSSRFNVFHWSSFVS